MGVHTAERESRRPPPSSGEQWRRFLSGTVKEDRDITGAGSNGGPGASQVVRLTTDDRKAGFRGRGVPDSRVDSANEFDVSAGRRHIVCQSCASPPTVNLSDKRCFIPPSFVTSNTISVSEAPICNPTLPPSTRIAAGGAPT